ncbi:MAG: NACHT domain-containing protein [Methylophilus sp.]|nr:NACHT domain-containing protein [Methylophilus sp.]
MLIESIGAIALPTIIKEALAPIIKRTVDSSLRGIRNVTPELMDLFTYRFSDYVECQFERHKYLNTLVFNQPKLLSEIYIPLTVKTEVNVNDKIKELELNISNFNMSFLPVYNRVLVTDTAGMGKSTLLRFLLLECIKSEYAIPIFIELRTLSKSQTISDVIYNQLNMQLKKGSDDKDELELSAKYIEKIMKSGDFILFLDGYDEIPFKDREFVTASINDFISKNSKNIYVISSRPESGLAAFPGFQRFNIRPLVKDESYSLISKYDKDGERSKQLIEKLKNNEFKGVGEYLKNPLLTTLLYRCYEYKQSLPLKKHVFYRQVFDALYEWHDSTKDGYNTREKKSKLDFDSFHRVLRVIGFISVMNGKVEADTDLILSWIRESKKICSDLTFSESDFLDDCVKAVPVLIKEGNFYRWSHKSLSEYFAAQFLCTEGKDQQNAVLEKIFQCDDLEKFSNVLDQIYDIEPSTFKKHFILPLAEEFRRHWESNYKNINPTIPSEILALRKAVTFDTDFFIGKEFPKQEDVDDVFNGLTKILSLENKPRRLYQLSITKTKNNKPLVCAKAIGKYCAILNILAAKKDPLIIQKHKIDLKHIKNQITHLPRKGFIKLDGASTSKLNSVNNFSAVTKLILANGWVLDHEKILTIKNDDSELKLAELAKSLLRNFAPKA